MSALILKDGTVISFNETTQCVVVLPRASILVIDDHIAAIEPDAAALPIPSGSSVSTLDVSGKIVSPGFINTHFHAWESVYRTAAPDITLAHYFGWLSQASPRATAAFSPEDVHVSALEGYLEGLNAGVTSFVEHAHNNWSAKVIEPGYRAAVDSGARVWWCFDVMERPDFSAEEQCQVLEGIALKERSPFLEMGLSLDGTMMRWAEDPAKGLERTKRLVKKLDVKAFTVHHLGGAWPGTATTPTALSSAGLPEIPLILSHASHLTTSDLQALDDNAHLSVSITPESEFHYGHGQTTSHLITPHASLGVDTNCTFSGDIITQSRLWLQSVRLRGYQAVLDRGELPRQTPATVEQAFLLATRQGGLGLNRPDVGVLRVGAKADIVVFDGDSPNMLGWSDPVAAVVLHANAGDVQHVLVGGQFRKRDFKLVDGKMGWKEVKEQFCEAAKRIQAVIKVPPPVPEKLWGQGTMGDVEAVSTVPERNAVRRGVAGSK